MVKFNLILSSTERSLKYLKLLIKNSFIPEYVIMFQKVKIKTIPYIKKEKINFSLLRTNEINSYEVIKEVKKTKDNLFIYSGYPGQIIRSKQILKELFYMLIQVLFMILKDLQPSITALYLKKKSAVAF